MTTNGTDQTAPWIDGVKCPKCGLTSNARDLSCRLCTTPLDQSKSDKSSLGPSPGSADSKLTATPKQRIPLIDKVCMGISLMVLFALLHEGVLPFPTHDRGGVAVLDLKESFVVVAYTSLFLFMGGALGAALQTAYKAIVRKLRPSAH